jgi:hypothetical protein
MTDDAETIGMHVRLLPAFYERELIPLNNWTGTIVEVEKSSVGERTKYVVQLDEPFQSQEEEVMAFEDEMEQCEPKP